MPDVRAPRPAHFTFSGMLLFVPVVAPQQLRERRYRGRFLVRHTWTWKHQQQQQHNVGVRQGESVSNVSTADKTPYCLWCLIERMNHFSAVLKTPCTFLSKERWVMSLVSARLRNLKGLSQILGSQSWIHVRKSTFCKRQTVSPLWRQEWEEPSFQHQRHQEPPEETGTKTADFNLTSSSAWLDFPLQTNTPTHTHTHTHGASFALIKPELTG